MAVCEFYFCHFLEVYNVAVEHDRPDLLDLVGLWVTEIFESKIIFQRFARICIDLIIGATVLIDYLIDILVWRIKVTLIIGDNLLLYPVNNERNLYFDDSWDLHRNGVFFPLLAGRLVV